MFNTIFTIVICVSIFGIILFLYVKKTLRKQLNYYLSKSNKKNKKI